MFERELITANHHGPNPTSGRNKDQTHKWYHKSPVFSEPFLASWINLVGVFFEQKRPAGPNQKYDPKWDQIVACVIHAENRENDDNAAVKVWEDISHDLGIARDLF